MTYIDVTQRAVVDLTQRFRQDSDRAGLFTYGRPGPHRSPRGNALVAEALRPAVGALLAACDPAHAGRQSRGEQSRGEP